MMAYFREGRDFNFGLFDAPLVLQEPLADSIDLNRVILTLEDKIPFHLVGELDSVYIGDFSFLKERDLNALYEDGNIYISNDQDDEADLLDDLVHELAHCVEESFAMDLYGDGTIEEEFLTKRERLQIILENEGHDEIDPAFFSNSDYDRDFDEYLYIAIGYPKLATLTRGLFISPYGATSLREYFANVFEEVFARDNLKDARGISPAACHKIQILSSWE